MRYSVMFCCLVLVACSAKRGNDATGKDTGASGSGAGASSGGAAKSGGGAGNSSGSASGPISCSTEGATRSCCGSGAQTCGGPIEFRSWGPCLDSGGAPLVCDEKCGQNEFGPGCDAGVLDSGSGCGPGEFGPTCDASVPPPPPLCKDPTVNNEPEILGAYSPADAHSVSSHGQIKLWVTDEHPPYIAPNEQIDASTGVITAPGDRAAKASDGYLFEPALYIAPETAETGGTPHFPQLIKGWYNNNPLVGGKKVGLQGAPIDPPPAGTMLTERYSGEDIWDVSALGLAPGVYFAEFVIHDGDSDRAIGCVTIGITP